MNHWLFEYVWKGNQSMIIEADTLYLAVEKFRDFHPDVPSLALYSVRCIK